MRDTEILSRKIKNLKNRHKKSSLVEQPIVVKLVDVSDTRLNKGQELKNILQIPPVQIAINKAREEALEYCSQTRLSRFVKKVKANFKKYF